MLVLGLASDSLGLSPGGGDSPLLEYPSDHSSLRLCSSFTGPSTLSVPKHAMVFWLSDLLALLLVVLELNPSLTLLATRQGNL